MRESKFSKRSVGIEWMDDLNCSGEVVEQTLRELEFINRMLGGNSISVNGIWKLIKSTSRQPVSILDLGCGGGDMLLLLNDELKKVNQKAIFKGIDANPHIVNYAANHCRPVASISIEAMNILSNEFRQLQGDIALATLFFHHFSEEQLVEILNHLHKQMKVGFVINDLHRHPLAYYSIKLLTKFFSKSAMVKYDAPLSVLRGFSKKELESILQRAGINNYTINWRWAFRWQVIVSKPNNKLKLF